MTEPTDDESRRSSRNGGSRPVPDPTELTDRAIAKAIEALTQYVNGQLAVRDERLRGIDTATNLRLGAVDAFSDQIGTAVGRLEDVHDEKFRSIATQFTERDTRAERESRDNKLAVDAAFAAQEKLAIAQQASNAEAIDKSEKATAETIKTNQELNKATTDSLTKSLDELKQAVTRIESRGIGASETRTEGRLSTGALVGLGSLAVGLVLAVVAVVSLLSPT